MNSIYGINESNISDAQPEFFKAAKSENFNEEYSKLTNGNFLGGGYDGLQNNGYLYPENINITFKKDEVPYSERNLETDKALFCEPYFKDGFFLEKQKKKLTNILNMDNMNNSLTISNQYMPMENRMKKMGVYFSETAEDVGLKRTPTIILAAQEEPAIRRFGEYTLADGVNTLTQGSVDKVLKHDSTGRAIGKTDDLVLTAGANADIFDPNADKNKHEAGVQPLGTLLTGPQNTPWVPKS